MICACSALLAVYLRGPNTAPLDTGFLKSSFSDMDVLDFVEQNVWVGPPGSTMTMCGAHLYEGSVHDL